ncbi:MAG: hypothetical protein OXC44_00970 [Proteobacteria bacterium]|nr:hypothetical protein [Pseudomonadota bacterium]
MGGFCVKVGLLFLAKQYIWLFLGAWIFLGCSAEKVPFKGFTGISLEDSSFIPVFSKNYNIISRKKSVEQEFQLSAAHQKKGREISLEVEEEREQEKEGLKKQEAFYLFDPECEANYEQYSVEYHSKRFRKKRVSQSIYRDSSNIEEYEFFRYKVYTNPYTYSRLINPVVLSTIKDCNGFDCSNARYHHQYIVSCLLEKEDKKTARSYEMIAVNTLNNIERSFNFYKNKKLGYNGYGQIEGRYMSLLNDYISIPMPPGRWNYRNSIEGESLKAPNLYIVSPSHISDADSVYTKVSRRFFENTFNDKKELIDKSEPSFVIYASKSKKPLPKVYLWESEWVVAHRFAQYVLASHSRFFLSAHSPDAVDDQLKRQKYIHHNPLSKHPSQPIYTSSDFYLYPLSFFFFPGDAKKNDRKIKQPLTQSAIKAWQVFVAAFANQWAHYAIAWTHEGYDHSLHSKYTKGLACLESDYNLRSDVMADGTEKLLTQKRLDIFQNKHIHSLMPSSHVPCDQLTDFTNYDIVGATLAYWLDRLTKKSDDDEDNRYKRVNQMLILLAQHIGDRIERGNLSFTIEDLFAEYVRHISIWPPMVYDYSPSEDSPEEKKRKFEEKTRDVWKVILNERQCNELQYMPLSMRKHWKSKGYFNCDWDPKPVTLVNKPKIFKMLLKQKLKDKKNKAKVKK